MDTVQTYDPTYRGDILGGAGRNYIKQDGPPRAESRGMNNLETQTNTLEIRVRALAEEVEHLMTSVGLDQLSPLNTTAAGKPDALEEPDNRIDVVAQNIRAIRLFADHIGNCVTALRERIA